MTAAGNYFKVVVEGHYLGQVWNNVWYYLVQAVAPDTNLAQPIAQEVADTYADLLLDLLVTGYTVDFVESINYITGEEIGNVGTDLVGTVATAGMPSWVNYTIRWNRRGAGRNYPQKRIPGVPEANTDGNVLLPAVVLDLFAFGNAMVNLELGAGNTVSLLTVNPQPPIGNVNIGAPPYKTQLPSEVVSARLGTQKTRRP